MKVTEDEIRKSFLRNLMIFREFRDYVKHEDNLINFRTTWFIQLTSFLFAAMAILLTRDGNKSFFAEISAKSQSNLISETNLYFGLLICFVGSIICITTFKSVRAAVDSLREIRRLWIVQYERNLLSKGTLDGSELSITDVNAVSGARIFPYMLGGGPDNKIAKNGRLSSLLIPIVVLIIWILIAFFMLLDYNNISIIRHFKGASVNLCNYIISN